MRGPWMLLLVMLVACSNGGPARTDTGADVPPEAVADAPDAPDAADLPAPPDAADVPGQDAADAADLPAGDPAPDVPVEVPPPDRALCAAAPDGPATRVVVDPAGPGRPSDGLGAISSAGNSRLLIDYPEPQRSDILDFLFKPGVGAALQVLKVEVPGDMNSTSGSEAAHRHTRDDLDCGRGYEWWLMREARARNPAIVLAALPWGSPSWTGGTSVYTPELIEHLVSWLDCAKQNGLHVDWIGTRNETGWDPAWIVDLKAALVAGGHDTRLVAADTHQTFGWLFGTVLSEDPALAAAVDALGVHYPCFEEGSNADWCTPPAEVLDLPVPVWASEQGGDPTTFARLLTRGYVDARITSTHLWPMVSSLPKGLPFPDSGLLVAPEPWSGYWRTRAPAWAFAHQTWFTEAGWRYLDNASGLLGGDRSNGAYVTLVSPDRTHATLIVETTTAQADQVLEVDFAGGLPRRVVHAWESDVGSWDTAAYLHHDCDLDPAAGPVRVTLRPGRLYTFTTTWGRALAEPARPAWAPFPLPYANDLEGDAPGREPRYLASQNGSFEVVPCGGGRDGRCLLQAAVGKPAFWGMQNAAPHAVLGDDTLGDCAVTVAAAPAEDGAVVLLARYGDQQYFLQRRFAAYDLRVATDGSWALRRHDPSTEEVTVLASGTADPWPAGTWRTLSLSAKGDVLRASMDGVELGTATDGTWTRGLAGIGTDGGATGSGWFPVRFDDLRVEAVPVRGPE